MRLRLPFIFLFILVLFIVVILYQSLFEKKNYIPKNINNKIENILIKEFNTNNNFFLKNLLEDKKIMAINIWASWCMPCRQEHEHIKKLSSIDSLAKRFFHPKEIDLILLSSDKSSLFFELWTKKEAYVKAIGRGISYGLDQFYVSCDDPMDVVSDVNYSQPYRLFFKRF